MNKQRIYCNDCEVEIIVQPVYLGTSDFYTHCVCCGSEDIEIDDVSDEAL